MSTQTINARFPSQEQAESAVRKLRALRADCFRVECLGAANVDDTPLSSHVEFAAEFGFKGSAVPPEAMATDPLAPRQGEALAFTLSASIPDQASERAQRVIEEAGGRMT